MPDWYSPVCDHVLYKVGWWKQFYEHGEVNATRQFLDPINGLVDKPTRYAHRLPFSANEFQHLLRLLRKHGTNEALTEELELVFKTKWPNGIRIPAQRLANGVIVEPNSRLVTLSFYPEHVKEIYEALTAAKLGGCPATIAEGIEEGGLF